MRINRNKKFDLKLLNAIRILKYIQKSRRTTKPLIAKALGISTPTVSALVDQLILDGFAEMIGTGESTDQGGKPPKIISFVPSSRAIISVYIGIGVVDIALMDLHSNTIERLRSKEVNVTRTELIDSILEKNR